MMDKNKIPDNALGGVAYLFDGMTKVIVVLWTVSAILSVAFTGAVGFIAWHFITKFW